MYLNMHTDNWQNRSYRGANIWRTPSSWWREGQCFIGPMSTPHHACILLGWDISFVTGHTLCQHGYHQGSPLFDHLVGVASYCANIVWLDHQFTKVRGGVVGRLGATGLSTSPTSINPKRLGTIPRFSLQEYPPDLLLMLKYNHCSSWLWSNCKLNIFWRCMDMVLKGCDMRTGCLK